MATHTGIDHYAELGVPRNAAVNDIKKAFRQLSKVLHPDTFAGKGDADSKHKEASQERFMRVVSAYNILVDPFHRAKYDANLGIISNMVDEMFSVGSQETSSTSDSSWGAATEMWGISYSQVCH